MTERRRGKGEGNIHQRPDGRWEARVDLGWRNGKRRRKSVYGDTRAEVVQLLRNVQRDVDAGRLPENGSIRVGDFLDHWLETIVKQKRSHGHWRNCESHIRLHIKPAVERVPLAKLTPLHVEQLLATVRAKGVGDVRCGSCTPRYGRR